jgi:Beta-lactamase
MASIFRRWDGLWITAWGVMTLVESGRIDLDAPVSRYLTRWTLPPSAFDNVALQFGGCSVIQRG